MEEIIPLSFFFIKFPMKLDFSFGCTGWKVEFLRIFFFFFTLENKVRVEYCVCVSAHME